MLGRYVNGFDFFGGHGHAVHGFLIQRDDVFDFARDAALDAGPVQDILSCAEPVGVFVGVVTERDEGGDGFGDLFAELGDGGVLPGFFVDHEPGQHAVFHAGEGVAGQ